MAEQHKVSVMLLGKSFHSVNTVFYTVKITVGKYYTLAHKGDCIGFLYESISQIGIVIAIALNCKPGSAAVKNNILKITKTVAKKKHYLGIGVFTQRCTNIYRRSMRIRKTKAFHIDFTPFKN